MLKSGQEIEKYKKFLEERLRPDFLKACEQRERVITEMREYEALLVTISTMQRLLKEAPGERLKTRVNLGKHFFVNAAADRNDRIVVKLVDDLFAELPLDRASSFVEKKVQVLEEKATQADRLASEIRAHIDLVLTSLEDYDALEKKRRGGPNS